MSPLAVVALGGNALLRRGEPAEASHQQANVRAAAQAIAALHGSHRLVVTHGNGPQVGLLALQAEAYTDVKPYPLDVLGAETEGMIGYLLDQALLNELPAGSRVATLLTQTVVDPADPAFAVPSKPIGPVYEPEVGERLALERGWTVRPDGPHVRRVVASPQPDRHRRDRDDPSPARRRRPRRLRRRRRDPGRLDPVRRPGRRRGRGRQGPLGGAARREARGGLPAHADRRRGGRGRLGTPEARAIHTATPAELRVLDFAAGSMGPKVDAACRFAERTGGSAGIGRLDQAAEILRGEAGTIVAGARYEGTRKPASPTSSSTPAASTAHQP